MFVGLGLIHVLLNSNSIEIFSPGLQPSLEQYSFETIAEITYSLIQFVPLYLYPSLHLHSHFLVVFSIETFHDEASVEFKLEFSSSLHFAEFAGQIPSQKYSVEFKIEILNAVNV